MTDTTDKTAQTMGSPKRSPTLRVVCSDNGTKQIFLDDVSIPYVSEISYHRVAESTRAEITMTFMVEDGIFG